MKLSVGDLCIKDTVTMNLKLANQCTGILAEIMKHFDNISVFQNRLQSELEWVNLQEIENVAVIP